MQSDPLDTKPSNRVGIDEDALPGFASTTPHDVLVAARTPHASRLMSMVNDAVGTVRDMAKEVRTAAVEQVGAISASVGNTAKERPLRTLGTAIAVGAIIGLLIGRR